VDLEIPYAQFGVLEDTALQFIYIPGSDSIPGLRVEIEGLDDGIFDMRLLSRGSTMDSVSEIIFRNNATGINSTAKLELSESDWNLDQDLDGDGTFESVIEPDSINNVPQGLSEFYFMSTSIDSLDIDYAEFSFETNDLSIGKVSIGLTDSLELCSYIDSTWSMLHNINIGELNPATRYFYQLSAIDSSGMNIQTNTSWFYTEYEYICGDANGDESVNISDAVYIINYVFIGGSPTPNPLESAEVNCDGSVNVSDAVYIINYVFIGGNEPCDTDGDGDPDC
jgi:hypothetical protein